MLYDKNFIAKHLHLKTFIKLLQLNEKGNMYNSLMTDLLGNIKSGHGSNFVMQVCQCMRSDQPTQSDIVVLLMWYVPTLG